MDLVAFQKKRDNELSEFENDYFSQKQKYVALISNAISETDPSEQSGLVEQILEINKELSSLVRDFISKQTQGTGYDEKSVLDLTNELIKYQQEYDQIRSNSDRIVTLKKILNEDKNKLSNLEGQFNILLGLIGVGILIILFMIFKIAYSGAGSLLPVAPQS